MGTGHGRAIDRRLSGRVAALLALALALPLAADDARPRPEPRIEHVDVREDADGVHVAFAVTDALGPETMERLQSGMTLAFRHRAELVVRRTVPLWPARVLASLVVEASATFDALTHQYTLERRLRLKQRGGEVEEREQHERSASIEAVTAWLTEVESIDLHPGPLPDGERLRLRVSADLERRYFLWLIPSRLTVSAERDLRP